MPVPPPGPRSWRPWNPRRRRRTTGRRCRIRRLTGPARSTPRSLSDRRGWPNGPPTRPRGRPRRTAPPRRPARPRRPRPTGPARRARPPPASDGRRRSARGCRRPSRRAGSRTSVGDGDGGGLPRLLTFLLASTFLAAPGPADEHLLLGARAFRAGRYAEALVEFKVAEKLGAGPDARAYAAAALVKLDRPEEAVELFGPKAEADPVLEFYRALACYQSRLFLCADQALEAAMGRFGPRVAEEARALRAQIQRTLSEEIQPEAVGWYLRHGEDAVQGGRPGLGRLYAEEARALGGRRKDCHRCAEAEALLAKAKAAAVAA